MTDRMLAAKNTSTRARVQITLDIEVPDAWGADCTIGQVYAQAKDSAVGILRRHFVVDGATCAGGDANRRERVRIVGEPIILAVHTEGRAA